MVKCSAKADFKKLGPRLGKQMKAVAAIIAAFSDGDVRRLQSEGRIAVTVDGTEHELKLDEVEILSEEIGAWTVAQEGGITVALDVRIDDELRAQGHAREVVNRIQGMRKTADFELTDRIHVQFSASPALSSSIARHRDFIARETLAVELLEVTEPAGDCVERFEIGDEWLVVGMTRSAV